jgi:hypothetical protein
MNNATIIELPHRLGKEEARRRMKSRIGELPSHIPGGVADVSASWPGEDRMALDVKALGQSVSATLDVEETVIRVALVLPPMLGLFAGKIADIVRQRGSTLLLGDER